MRYPVARGEPAREETSAADSRFDWYERVRVAGLDPAKASIAGKLGAVVGKAQGEDGRWSYGVFVYDEKCVWSCWDHELTPTGEFDRRESFYADGGTSS